MMKLFDGSDDPVTPDEAAVIIIRELMPDGSDPDRQEAIRTITKWAIAWGQMMSDLAMSDF